jgi:hypothetical protein
MARLSHRTVGIPRITPRAVAGARHTAATRGVCLHVRIRRAILLFLPLAIVASGLAGLVYLVAQQEGRWLANEPQVQLAEDAAARLDAGGKPGDQVGSATVDIARSLAPFVVVYSPTGTILATDGTVDGQPPDVPAGVLDSARSSGRNAVTWQPRAGVRVATVTVPWSGGSVLAGRSLRLVEQEASNLELVVGAAWLATLAALAVAALIVARLWPRAAAPA